MTVKADVQVLDGAVRELLKDGWVPWPGGYPDDLELGLIDAVFSIRARYGHTATNNHPATGVPAVVHRWRKYRGDNPPDLHRLANADPEQLASVLQNSTVTAGRTKTSAVSEAASNLIEAEILTSVDLREYRADAKRAYVRVRGLSWVTFSYFCMLLGVPDVKADTWITRFVGQSVGRDVSAHEAYDLLHGVADGLAQADNDEWPRTASELDHAVWAATRAR